MTRARPLYYYRPLPREPCRSWRVTASAPPSQRRPAAPVEPGRKRRAMFRLLDLPPELLHRIATTLDGPGVVVAVASARMTEERDALRRGVDDMERARFGGRLGLTIREAEAQARTWCPGEFLETRQRAAEVISRKADVSPAAPTLTYLISSDASRDAAAREGPVVLERIKTMLAFGASPDEYSNNRNNFSFVEQDLLITPLHLAITAAHLSPIMNNSQTQPTPWVEVAELLVAAGADVNKPAMRDDRPGLQPLYSKSVGMVGRSPLSRALGDNFNLGSLDQYKIARLLIENGADVAEAERGYLNDIYSDLPHDGFVIMLTRLLERDIYTSRPELEQLIRELRDMIEAALDTG